jgi:hypothetical protein
MDVKTLKSELCDAIKLMATERPCDSYQIHAEKELPADNDEFEEFVLELMDEIGANLYEFICHRMISTIPTSSLFTKEWI